MKEELFRLLMTTYLPLMKNVFTQLAKNILMLLHLAAAASATDQLLKRLIIKYINKQRSYPSWWVNQ